MTLSPVKTACKTLASVVFCLISFNAAAQQPEWIPVAELVVGSIGQADPSRMSEAMNRCTALNMTLSGLLAEESPQASKEYQDQALKLVQSGILIEAELEKQRTNVEPDIKALSGLAMVRVKEMLTGYNDWLVHNYDVNGSYISDEFEIEMKSCEFAARFIRHMLGD